MSDLTATHKSIFLCVFNQCLRLIIARVSGGEISIIDEKRFWGFSRLLRTLSLLIFHRVIYCQGVCQMAEIVHELRRALFLAKALTVSQPAHLRSPAAWLPTLLLCSHSDVRCVLVHRALGQLTLASTLQQRSQNRSEKRNELVSGSSKSALIFITCLRHS